MTWLGRLFRVVPKEELEGVSLCTTEPYWELDGPRTFGELLNALKNWVPDGAVLYFEGGCPDAEILNFMATHSIPELSHLAMGTIWPRPKVFHVPATLVILTKLARIMARHAEPELAVHFHVYRNDTVLLEWHDAFSQPMLISGCVPDQEVRILAERFGERPRRIVEPSATADG
jgi:hypothetical protein